MSMSRPPYRAAALMVAVVLAGYLASLAPTVTFWDAGELIAAARTLGIPHPPGTPLFVLVAHVWGMLLPIGNYAWRLNLFSASCAALASGCWFLVAHDSVRRMGIDADGVARSRLAVGAGIAAVLLTAFGYTTWQNSTETEVYSTAMLLVAIVAWIAVRWREARTTDQGSRLLLMALYLGGISIGNHLLALLVGPALVVMLMVEARRDPLGDAQLRRSEWARIAIVGSIWLLLIALGLGNTTLTIVTGVLALGAAGLGVRARQSAFAAVAFLIVAVGVSTYLFLLLRARQGPWINEADPSTWDALLGVVRRAQYPVRTPLDDPTVLHGVGNPGRSLALLGFQLANYAQYFDWQWAKSIGPTVPSPPWRIIVSLLFAALGVIGAARQQRTDRGGFALLGTLFVVTGLGLVLYMDFKPGPSIGWDRWTQLTDHEVRERDYFFVASFVAWGVWAAIGAAELSRIAVRRAGVTRWSAGYAVLAVALLPVVLNWKAASRQGNPDETFAQDFARALLQSVPPGGILFTYGDNDTFPLWHAQAVDGIRRDVSVVCLALAETPWYMRQLRDGRPDPVDRTGLAAVWRDVQAPTVTWPLFEMDDASIAGFTPFLATQDLVMHLPDSLVAHVAKDEAIYGKDAVALEILQQNAGRRPIAWSVTAAGRLFGLQPHLVMQGLALVLPMVPPDSTGLSQGLSQDPSSPRIDLEATRRLASESWRYGRLLDARSGTLDPTNAAMAATLALPMVQAGAGYFLRGDTAKSVSLLERAARLTQDSTPMVLLRMIRGKQ